MDKLNQLINAVRTADSINELNQIFDMYLNQSAENVTFGVEKLDRESISKARIAANDKAIEIINRLSLSPDSITEEERKALRQYTGFGGIGGSTNEYYTPQWVASGAWSAISAYGINAGNVLEPSAGVGVFSATKPAGTIMTSVELDKTSSAINQVLHPDDLVINSAFEQFARDDDNGPFDAIIGNPPYGSRDTSIALDPSYNNIKLADQYFATRCIDKAAGGAIICLILPSRIVESKSLSKWRREIALKAEFLGAHRLPTGTFSNNGSDTVVTDMVVWRKHSKRAIGLINAASPDLLKETNVLWDTYINGKWFQTDGRKFIHGSESTIGKGQWKRKVVDRGNITNDQIQQALSKKFDSRINWLQLGTVEPSLKSPKDGDHRVINGVIRRYERGEWVESIIRNNDGSLNEAVYGFKDEDSILLATSNPEILLTLDFQVASNIARDLPWTSNNKFKSAMKAVSKLPGKKQEQAFRSIMLGNLVSGLSDLIAKNDTSDSFLDLVAERRTKVSDLVLANYKKYGSPNKLTGINALSSAMLAKVHAHKQSINENGELSNLLDGSLVRENTIDFNYDDPRQVLASFYKNNQLKAITLDKLKLSWSNTPDLNDDQLLEYLSKQPDIAINSDGSISQMHHATSGDIAAKLNILTNAVANSKNPVITANLQRQIDVINERRTWTDITDIKFKLTDNYIPRHIVLEFLHSRGYDHFVYAKVETNTNGEESYNDQYIGDDGFFTGYRSRDGIARSNANESYERQLENYLNKVAVRGGAGNEGKAVVRESLRQLDDDFSLWVSTSDHANEMEFEFNNRFNGYIEPEYDDSPLGLEGISGKIETMNFQNATIRRHSDDGCGIIGFGTGLGKTFTGLALGAYNLQVGRSKRIAYVVPKSVIENWFNEADLFFGAQHLSDKIFVGVAPMLDNDGHVIREPILNEDGTQAIGKNGDPLTKAKLNIDTSSSAVAATLHQATQSSAKMIFMTKDVYEKIPLRDSSIAENVEEMVNNGLIAGSNKYVEIATKHREKEKNNKFEAKYANQGGQKNEIFPYYEDLLIDTVIVDEGHDFRNSYKSGSFGNRLAFLPNTASADRALDMQIKNNYIKRQNNGRGCYMLSATPTVNSPIDAFNMLSQVVPQSVWTKLGIVDSDDFIRIFGRTGETAVHKLSGKVETKEALLGFQNLDALRSLFHRYVSIKNIMDVSDTVHVPKQVAQTSYVDMSQEQESIYEELRVRAEALSNPDSDEAKEIAEQYPDDTVFGLIRSMDKACTDLDLYNGVITYIFKKSEHSKVSELANNLPKHITVRRSVLDEKTGVRKSKNVKIPASVTVSNSNDDCRLIVTADLDSNVIKLLTKHGLEHFTHPVSPKYAKFLDNAKNVYLDGGKQLVFTEEKTQHIKIARMISQYIGCPISEIGILNSDTVAGKKGSNTEEQEESGLEILAKAYNESRYRFMILNKKGEVGVNLHKGTTDIHHLTLPFTPASLTQRNGRGARVGSSAKEVNVHYYAGKGSFDKFRISTIERKARWIDDLFNGTDKMVENGNADDPNEHLIMLAPDPEEARRRIEENEQLRKKKLEDEYRRVAAVNVNNYLKAIANKVVDRDTLEQQLISLKDRYAEAEKLVHDRSNPDNKWERDRLKIAQDDLFEIRNEMISISGQIKNLDNTDSAIKRYKPLIDKAITNSYLNIDNDIFSHPELYFASKGRVARLGGTYIAELKSAYWSDETYQAIVNVQSFDRKAGQVSGMILDTEDPTLSASRKGTKFSCPITSIIRQADVDQPESELLAKCLAGLKISEVSNYLNQDRFMEFAKEKNIRFQGINNYLTEENGQFDTINMGNFSEFIVYPDLSDISLQNRLAKYCANHTMEKGSLPRLGSWIEAILGTGYKERIDKFGNKATDAEITKWINDVIISYEDSFSEYYNKALLSGSYNAWISRVRDFVFNKDMPNITNRDDENRIATLIVNNYRQVVKQRSEDLIQRSKDNAYAIYIELLKSPDGRSNRIQQLSDIAKRYKSEHHFIKNTWEAYDNNKILLMSDLTAINATEQLNDGEKLHGDSKYDVEWILASAFRSGIIASATQDFVSTEINPLSDIQKSKLDNIDVISIDDLSDKLSKIGITAKTNTDTLIHSYRRKSTRFEPYSAICMQDINGKSGSLYKHRQALKEQFNAKFCSDINDEFQGCWWVVSSKSNLTELANVLL